MKNKIMRVVISIFIAGALLSFIPADDIYKIRFSSFEGMNQTMEKFKGKKLLIIVIPVTQTSADSIFLNSLDTFSRHHEDRLSVLAVPAFDQGYDESASQGLKSFYKKMLGNQITVSKEMFTCKRTAENQHELFAWLTHKEKNLHFDMDVKGVGQKFFISRDGELYAVLDPEVNFNSRIIQRMITDK